MKKITRFITALLVLTTASCSEAPVPGPLEPVSMTVPAGADSTGPRLSQGDDGSVVLSWMEPGEDGTTLRYAALADGEWQEPSSVALVADMFVNWDDLPSVVPLQGPQWMAHWLQKSGDGRYAYDVVISQSDDGGITWSEPMSPHSDGTPTEHGFVSIFAHEDRAGLIWLDGRKTANKTTNEAGDAPVASGMTLRAAFVDPGDELQGEQLIDELICDCCQTDVAVSASGPVAVYRDRTVGEIRDIYVTRFIDGRWQAGIPIADDNWKIAGCPVNGPAITAVDDFVAVAWFSAADNQPRVRVKLSDDGGNSFGTAIDIAAGKTLGRVGVAILDEETAAVSWLQNAGDALFEINVRSVSVNGGVGPVRTVSSDAAAFSVPQMVVVNDRLVFAWTENDEGVSRVASASLSTFNKLQ